MRKETYVAVGVVTAVVVSVVIWLVASSSSAPTPDKPTQSADTVMTESTETERMNNSIDDDRDWSDQGEEVSGSSDVTRIIVVDPKESEITELLSEKVIKDGKIVDQE